MNAVFEIENGQLLSCLTDETEITIPENVTIIGEHVFKGNRKLEKVILPDSLKIIAAEAFKGCTALVGINLPPSLEEIGADAFKGCMSLTEIAFPNSLTRIGDYAFHRCHSLKAAILPDSVRELGKCAFLYCDGMETVSVGGVKRIGRQTFTNCTSLREIRLNSSLEIENLGDDIFTGCVNIKKISLTNGECFKFESLAAIIGTDANPIAQAVAKSVYQTMKLENGVLYKLAVNLKCFEIPEGITCIEKSCFYNKKGIARIVLPKSLREIKANAFGNCISLEEIVFRNDCVEIDGKAFKGCNNLERIILGDEVYYPKKCLSDSELPELVRKVGEQVLSDFYISGGILMKYRGSEERVCVPDAVTVIGEGCFENNNAIGRVVLPNRVREIRENAFKGCVSMQTLELSEELEVIGRSAFENCRKLIRITLPQNVRRLGESAFKRCFKLNSFVPNDALEEIGDMAFYGCTSLESIELPKSTVLKGRLIFFNSGIGGVPELSEITDHERSEDGISPYEFCKNAEIVSLNITGPNYIGKYAFSGCPNLSELVIDDPDCVIGEHAFEKCASLKSVKLNVKGVEKNAFSFCRSLENIEISGAEIIGSQAFLGCGSLSGIKFSESVTKLGERCFEECVSIKSFEFDGIKVVGERAFSRCEGLEEVELPGDICVRRHAFEDCCFIKKISLSSAAELKSNVFFGCTDLREISLDGVPYFFDKYSQGVRGCKNALPERVQEIISSAYSCFDIDESLVLNKYTGNAVRVKLPRDVTALGDEAFRNRIRTVDIDIPESVSNIGKLTFAGSGWLDKMRSKQKITVVNNMMIDAFNCGESAEIPADIKRVCSWSFAGNTELREVRFLGSRTIIDEYAFRNCVGLKRIIDENGAVYQLAGISSKDDPGLPEFVRRIFAECVNCFKVDKNGTLFESTGNIKDLAFVSGIKAIGERVYKDCNLLCRITLCSETETIGAGAFENGKWLQTVKNAVGVRRIEALAFCGCQSLEEIELSDKLEFIGKRAFEHCCRLREITIPEGVRVIHERTFFRCKSLKRIVLPSTLEIIEREAFAFCNELEEVIFPRGSINVDERAFAHCLKLTRHGVPQSVKIADNAFEGGVM
ncbi:MAG: leucine-rich repeat domain-containing protein [Oscillospiraceae bacterium]|nr:leucine-rich repeat domain-containing protein [Oscillospiraceae bacterium]